MPVELFVSPESLVRYARHVEAEYRSFVEHMLDLLDALARLRDATGDHARVDALLKQANSALLRHGIRATAQIGDHLDLRYHQVVGVDTAEGHAPDTIVSVVQMGYEMMVGDTPTIRAAHVVIAGPEPARGDHGEGK